MGWDRERSQEVPLHEWLGRTLAEFRENAGLTQRAMGKRLNIDPSSISNYEKGVTRLSLMMYVKYCNVVGIDAGILVRTLAESLAIEEEEK